MGKPSQQLSNDPKYQGDLLTASIKVGEQLAFSALSSELLILLTLAIPRNKWHKYIGRSQYPKFKEQSIATNNKPICSDEDVLYRGSVKNLAAAATLQTGKSVGYNPKYFVKVQELQTLLCQSVANSARFVHDCSESLAICTATIRINFKDIVFDNIREIIDIASDIFGCLLTVSSNFRFFGI